MNEVVLIGRLVHDPQVRYVNEDLATCGFRLAVDRQKKGEADFINCKVFGKQAENLQKYKHKGDQLGIHGRIETGSYKNKEGQTVYTTEVIADRVEFISTPSGQSQMRHQDMPSGFEEVDEAIPF